MRFPGKSAEIRRLRIALHECAVLAGEDYDDASAAEDIASFAVKAVRMMQEDVIVMLHQLGEERGSWD